MNCAFVPSEHFHRHPQQLSRSVGRIPAPQKLLIKLENWSEVEHIEEVIRLDFSENVRTSHGSKLD